MNNLRGLTAVFFGFISIFVSACAQKPVETVEIKHYPLDNMEGVITRTNTQIDQEIASDGNGSLGISATKPTTIKLYETGNIDIENARLFYQAKLRTEGVEGQVYLEMWCQFSGKGEFFSRALHAPLSGSQEWTSQETTFFMKKGQNPDNIKLNLVINGKGKVWIDDIRLAKALL